MRRIITGHNAEGKSVVMHEGPPARSIGEDVGGLYEIWNTESTPFTTKGFEDKADICLLYTSPSPRDKRQSRMPSSA